MSAGIKLKHTARILNGYAYDSKSYIDDGEPIVRIGDVKKIIDLVDARKVPKDIALATQRFKINKGDHLIALTGATIGKTFPYLLDQTAYLNQRVASVRAAKDYNQKYIGYAMNTEQFKEEVLLSCFGGAQENIGANELANISIPKHNTNKQLAIADYLDIRTQTIDKMLATKNKIRKILAELRQSIIFDTVIAGKDSSMTFLLKDKWVGAIPEHWKITKLSHVSRIKTGGTPSKDNLDFWTNGEIPWLASGEVNKGVITYVDSSITTQGMASSSATMLPIDTVMVALNGQGKTKGMAALLKVPATCNQSLAGVITDKKVLDSSYLYYYLKCKYANIRGLKGEARDGLNLDIIGSIPVPIPPLNEQLNIVRHVTRRLDKVDVTDIKLHKSMILLEEYRSSLISNAVAGKVEI